MTLPGVACIYYGQEIGMVNSAVRSERIRDPNNDGMNVLQTRDGERLPMQWDDSFNAGMLNLCSSYDATTLKHRFQLLLDLKEERKKKNQLI